MALYLNYINFSRVSRILFPLLFFATSCQLNQSLEKIKTTLFVEEEKKKYSRKIKAKKLKLKKVAIFLQVLINQKIMINYLFQTKLRAIKGYWTLLNQKVNQKS